MINVQMARPQLNFRGYSHHPYYILTMEISQRSWGSRAPYVLCHILNEMGFEAYTTSSKVTPYFRTPRLTYDIIKKHQSEGRHPIAIYTELIEGNPLGADVVARWMLNRMGNIGEIFESGEDDLIFYSSEVFAPKNTKSINILAIREPVDASIFNMDNVDNNKRSGFCFYAHKYIRDGKKSINKKFLYNGISLCQDIPRTHKEIAAIMKTSKILYTYDISRICREAYSCGCPVVIVGTDYLYNNHRIDENFLQDTCVLNEEEIDIINVPIVAVEKMKKSLEKYEALLTPICNSINNFVEITQARANSFNVNNNKNDLNELITFSKKHKNIIIYGTGPIAQNCFNILSTIGVVNINGFMISDNIISGDTLYDLPVYKFSDCPMSSEEYGLVLAMRMCHRDEVLPLIKEKGYSYIHYCIKPK